MTDTYDNKRVIKPFGLQDIDMAFRSWWDEKLNLHLTDKAGNKQKVPVQFVAPERWAVARQEGVRDRHGTLRLPIVAISRTRMGGPNEEPYNRIVADTKAPKVYSKRIHPKSSLIKELIDNREWNIDPSLPIYEVFTSRVPDHMVLQYEVSIWTAYIEELNEIVEKVGQKYDYLSVKSFAFDMPTGAYFVAFQDEELTDESNTDDYTDSERIIRRNFVFNVPGYIIPEHSDTKSQFRRYLSQTRIIIKNEVSINKKEFEDLVESHNNLIKGWKYK